MKRAMSSRERQQNLSVLVVVLAMAGKEDLHVRLLPVSIFFNHLPL